MLDLRFIRENSEIVKKAIRLKKVNLDLDQLLRLDNEASESKKKLQKLQEEKNINAKAVPAASGDAKKSLIENGRKINQSIEEINKELVASENALKDLLWLVPNIPAPDVPEGMSDEDNVEVRRWGKAPTFNFPLKDHIQLLDLHGWAEFERIAKVAGSRTYALKGDLVLLEQALINFALVKLKKKGFNLLSVPSLVREFALYGTGHFPTAKDQNYFLPEDNMYLSGTAEVPINSLHSGETLEESQLPLLYGGVSPCFRREAGSAGRDVRGLMRVHQFMKVEQFVICKNDPEESARWHKILMETSEEMMQELELPYRVIECCTGDMGAGKVKMHDIEAWVPSESRYRETHSCSTLHDWQARRVNLRYRDSDGKVKFCHSLNNTAIATPRILIPLLENHQQEDGSVRIPKPLQPFFMGLERISNLKS